jgi:hypothetical protein
MGGSTSKASVINNITKGNDLDKMLTKLLKSVIGKYSELVDKSQTQYYQLLTDAYKNNTALPPPPDKTSISNAYGKACDEDLVAVFEKKLNRFPLWAIRNQGLFSSSLEPILMEITDTDDIKKKDLCTSLSRFYMAILKLIEDSVNNLVKCRVNMLDIINRVNKSFQDQNGNVHGAIVESAANKTWFKHAQKIQIEYAKHVKRNSKMFAELDAIKFLDAKEVNKFIGKMEKESREISLLPQECEIIVNQLKRITTIDQATSDACKTLNIPQVQCSKTAIDDKQAADRIINARKSFV